MSKPLRVLIAEDSENDAMLVLRQLRRSGYAPTHHRVATAEEMSAALEKEAWDIVISDYVMPGFGGLAALGLLREKAPDLPCIIVSGHIGEETAVEAMKAGARDYIMKSNLKRLSPAIARELAEAEARREKRRAEEMLAEYQREFRSRASKLLLAEEAERRRIATELHDCAGQTLALSILRLDMMRKSLQGDSAESIKEVSGLLRQLVAEMRALIFELSPPILYDVGLEAAVKELGAKLLGKNGIQFFYSDDGQPKPLDNDVRVSLFQSVRELLVNVVKHARAHVVRIILRRVDGQIQITVEDDGIGFDAGICSGTTMTTGFGFFSIRERLHHIGGWIEAESQSGHGSRIVLMAPLNTEGSKQVVYDNGGAEFI